MAGSIGAAWRIGREGVDDRTLHKCSRTPGRARRSGSAAARQTGPVPQPQARSESSGLVAAVLWSARAMT